MLVASDIAAVATALVDSLDIVAAGADIVVALVAVVPVAVASVIAEQS